MVSPVPKHLRTDDEHAVIPARLRDHVIDIKVNRQDGIEVRYGVALMMIREGCSDPAGLARRILSEFETASLPSNHREGK